MTDRDPAAPRRAPSPDRMERAPATALRDRWWWSPALTIVVGLVVIAYQADGLRSAEPVWGTWAVAVLGLALSGYGVAWLVRAARSR